MRHPRRPALAFVVALLAALAVPAAPAGAYTVEGATANEGDPLVFVVTTDPLDPEPLIGEYTPSAGLGTESDDFSATPQTATIASAGRYEITVQTTEDTVHEPAEA